MMDKNRQEEIIVNLANIVEWNQREIERLEEDLAILKGKKSKTTSLNLVAGARAAAKRHDTITLTQIFTWSVDEIERLDKELAVLREKRPSCLDQRHDERGSMGASCSTDHPSCLFVTLPR